MSENIKKIGVMTSGGDCAGLNAVIRAVTLRAEHYGWEIYGILNGTEGLTSRPLKYRKLTAEDFNGPWMRMSGTILGTINKGVPAESLADLTEKFKTGVKELSLDAIAVIGGDGSMRIVSEYCKGAGINMVGIPKTIDNDTPITEHSVGFATARDVCVEALDRLDATAQSHHRVMILEVMGRDAGHIAMHSAIAGGADVCLVPEIPYSLKGVIKTLRNIKKHGRQHSLMVVAEGVKTEDKENIKNISNTYGGIGSYISSKIKEIAPDLETRVTVLGHVQRGGTPASYDRIAAMCLGVKAVDVLAAGKTDRMVAIKGTEIIDVDLNIVTGIGNQPLDLNGDIVRTAKSLGIYIGD